MIACRGSGGEHFEQSMRVGVRVIEGEGKGEGREGEVDKPIKHI